jgi:DNA invertase Pin-like site-specific DNA recombinase
MIRERTRGGLLAAKKKGIHCGRPKTVFDRRRLRDLREQGKSVRQIGAKLGMSKSAVARALAGAVPKLLIHPSYQSTDSTQPGR